MNRFPLAGITVADFTWIGAGSYTTKILADFGADVIKIESVERLDTLREAKPFQGGVRGVNRSGYFADPTRCPPKLAASICWATSALASWNPAARRGGMGVGK